MVYAGREAHAATLEQQLAQAHWQIAAQQQEIANLQQELRRSRQQQGHADLWWEDGRARKQLRHRM
jgi:hypothetical protein